MALVEGERITAVPTMRGRLRCFVVSCCPLLLLLGFFAATVIIVPVMTPVATTDDWGYSRSVEILVEEGRLTVFPVVAATAVFQIIWGAFFAELFGMSLGLMRVSTIVMVGLGAVGLWGLLSELKVTPGRRVLGVAAYLFNPLTFVLSYTFMTDPHFTSLLIIATALFARGFRPDDESRSHQWAGSIAAACAILTRQQGVLIVSAVVGFMVVTGRLQVTRTSIWSAARVVTLPVAAIIGYGLWLRFFNDVPAVQQGFLDEIVRSGWGGGAELVRHLGYIQLLYGGFFVLPLTVAAAPFLWRFDWRFTRRGWIALACLLLIVAIGLTTYAGLHRYMPYVDQFVGSGGLGPPDVRGSRPRVFQQPFFIWLTIVTAVSVVIALVVLCRRIGDRPPGGRGPAGLVVAVFLSQLAGIVPPSFHYLNRGYSLDRYLLPLAPLGIALLLWALNTTRIVAAFGWAVIATYAVFGVIGTRDYLVYLDTVWGAADRLVEQGIPPDKIDAGAAWDGYHLYTYGLDNNITVARTTGGPWWMTFYGLASDSSFVISARPIRGYYSQSIVEYDPWLLTPPQRIHVLRRFSTTSNQPVFTCSKTLGWEIPRCQ